MIGGGIHEYDVYMFVSKAATVQSFVHLEGFQ